MDRNAHLTAPREIKQALATRLSWVAWAGLEARTQLPVANRAVRQFFRLFQWELAGLVAPRALEPLVKAMEADFPSDVDDLVGAVPRILYLSKLLLETDVPISPPQIVAHILELRRLSELANRLDRRLRLGSGVPPMYPGLERSTFADLVAPSLVPRIRKVEHIRELVSSLDALETEDRERLLGGFITDDAELLYRPALGAIVCPALVS